MIKVLAFLAALLPSAALADFQSDLKKAAGWDYTAQRNVALAYLDGTGIPQNATEGCVWRSVIVFARGADISESDVANLASCQKRGLLDEASKRAPKLLQQLQRRPARNVDLDLADLAAQACDGAKCPEEYKGFAASYKAAVRGETPAMWAVAECYQSIDCSPTGFNGFQACVWTHELIRVVGDRDPKLRSWRNTLCGSGPLERQAVDYHVKAIREMRAAR